MGGPLGRGPSEDLREVPGREQRCCFASGCRRRWVMAADCLKLGRVFAVNGRCGPVIARDNRTSGTDRVGRLAWSEGVFALVSGGAPGRIRTCAPASGGR